MNTDRAVGGLLPASLRHARARDGLSSSRSRAAFLSQTATGPNWPRFRSIASGRGAKEASRPPLSPERAQKLREQATKGLLGRLHRAKLNRVGRGPAMTSATNGPDRRRLCRWPRARATLARVRRIVGDPAARPDVKSRQTGWSIQRHRHLALETAVPLPTRLSLSTLAVYGCVGTHR